MRATLLLALAALASTACATAPDQDSMHHVLVCAGGDEDACPASERTAEFDRWAKAALRHPGSTFSVWIAGAAARSAPAFVACVPERWGSNVMGAKAAFLQDGRSRAAAGGQALPQGCTPADEPPVRLVLLTEGSRTVLEVPPEQHHLAVLCDRSDSMLGVSCDARALEAAHARWLERSGGVTGSTFAVYGIGTTRDTASVIFKSTASNKSPGERIVALLAGHAQLPAALSGAPTGSAIAEALDVASSDLKARQGTKAVLLFTDLRQVTPGTWNFEVAAPEPAGFSGWLRGNRLLPGLRGVELQACGLHHRRAPGAKRYDAALAHRVELAWKGALKEAGGALAVEGPACQDPRMASLAGVGDRSASPPSRP